MARPVSHDEQPMTDMIHKRAERIKISADVFLLYVGVGEGKSEDVGSAVDDVIRHRTPNSGRSALHARANRIGQGPCTEPTSSYSPPKIGRVTRT